ncbi:hypothetical protein [Deinococcus multiflagellatus]|uniref:Uncharacterized protein n=1 Tax=Deinococcus multiflagellatus TaxID=1656887 RepID=A0ABW1ZMW6_9DEIO
MRALFLLPALFLAACAPAATGPEDLQGPLAEGERWTITGFDQNNDPMNGEVVVPKTPATTAWTAIGPTAAAGR